ncbi:MAG: molybdopterin-dependent oxidoreductase [Pseudomonadota bacterium]
MEVTEHKRACHLCEAICGLVIEVKDGEIESIKGDKDDPLSRGHICPKAVALQDIQNDPDRLRFPLRRVRQDANKKSTDDTWEEIGWEEAFDEVAYRLVEIRTRLGDNALAVYLGNPSVHNYGILTHQQALFSHLRTQNRYSATSVDQLPQHLVSLALYGHKDLLPVPDIDRTDFFLMLGANPIASNGSIWTVPDVRQRISDLIARDGKLVVIDPRYTETAEIASEHHGINPATDVLFLAALLNTIFTENLTKIDESEITVSGLKQVREAVGKFSAEAVTNTVGIAAETILAIAREFAQADNAVCYGRMGVSVQSFGTLNHWLIQLLNIVTGNFNKTGGSLFTHPAVNDFAKTRPGKIGRFKSRVSGKPEFNGELPASALAEEILTPGEGQIRALFTCAGNPVLSTPNGRQLDEALNELEFLVSLDPYLNETTRHADVILPPTSPLEHDHYDLAFLTLAVRNIARFSDAVFEKPEGTMHDWEIFTQLGERVAKLLGHETREQLSPAELIDKLLQAGHYSKASGNEHALSLAKLRANPSGIDLGPLQPSMPERIQSAEHVIQCAIPEFLEDLERAEKIIDADLGLRLIGRRHVRSNNSWMHNYHRLVKGKPRSQLLMHPEDMKARGIESGNSVVISSRVGEETTHVESSTDMIKGTVCLPHGYGHNRSGVRLSIASEIDGVSLNDLTDDQAGDPISGNAALNGVPVEVRLAN